MHPVQDQGTVFHPWQEVCFNDVKARWQITLPKLGESLPHGLFGSCGAPLRCGCYPPGAEGDKQGEKDLAEE
jgi:hypothetical protein